LDEPFGALDKNLRLDMQIEVKRLQRELGITTVMVTHDQEEALSMADRIAVMNKGRVEQFGTAEDIYDRPQTLFVATFVGTANLLKGRLSAREPGFEVALDAGGSVALGAAAPCSRNGAVIISVRPEHVRFSDGEGLAARVNMVLPLGPSVVYEIALADGTPLKLVAARGGEQPQHGAGDMVRVRVAPQAPVSVFQA
jgi:putative spermidine/putrescine transport system ATP-binding protein